jgi:hypothetical protein
MVGNNVRIQQEDCYKARVFIDDVEVKGVTDIKYSIGVNNAPVVKLEFVPGTLNNENKISVSLDSEKLADEVIKRTNEESRSEKGLIKTAFKEEK